MDFKTAALAAPPPNEIDQLNYQQYGKKAILEKDNFIPSSSCSSFATFASIYVYMSIHIKKDWNSIFCALFRLPDNGMVFQAASYIGTELTCNSQAVIKSLGSLTAVSKYMLECYKSLQVIAKRNRLPHIWISDHRLGTTKQILPKKERIGMFFTTCKLLLRDSTYHQAE